MTLRKFVIPLVAASLAPIAQVDGQPRSSVTLGATYATRDEWWVLNGNGCSLYVAEFGHGPPIVIIHGGFGAEHSYLLDAFTDLRRQYHLVFYDQRGSLRSPYQVFEKGGSRACPDSLITAAAHVADLEELRKQLGFEKLTLVAHSMGAFIALSYQARFPDHVAGLVLLAPGVPLRSPVTDQTLLKEQRAAVNAMFDRPEIAAEKKKAGVDGPKLSDRDRIYEWRIRYAAANLFHVSRWRQLRGGMAFYNPEAGSATATTIPKNYDFVSSLESRSCPTSIILGDYDIADVGARVIRQQLAGVRNVKLTVVHHAGHALWIDQPAEFRKALERALKLCL